MQSVINDLLKTTDQEENYIFGGLVLNKLCLRKYTVSLPARNIFKFGGLILQFKITLNHFYS